MQPFDRITLAGFRHEVLMRGRWGNADIYSCQISGTTWAIKDFTPCHPVVRETWGRLMVWREYKALIKLSGISGVPEEPFLLDHYALCYHFIPGKNLRITPPEEIREGFFPALEKLVAAIHQKNLVHLDIRNQRNILMGEDGQPTLLDFQSSIHLEKMPGFLQKLLKNIDLSGVYKVWSKKAPETLDGTRKALLETMNQFRFLWFLKGYPFGTRKSRRI